MAKHPQVFPPLMVNMCRAGEVGGFLDNALLPIAANFEAEVKLRGKIKAAMTYPVVVFVMAILAVVGMLLFIVPIFAGMFDDLGRRAAGADQGARLPVRRHEGGRAASSWCWSSSAVVWGKIKHPERVREVVDPLMLKLPVFGALCRKIALCRFTRNLGTMLRSGVPILQALEIVAETTGNVVIERAVRDVQESVRQGESWPGRWPTTRSSRRWSCRCWRSARTPAPWTPCSTRSADFYDQEVEATTEALTALIEPLMIAFLGRRRRHGRRPVHADLQGLRARRVARLPPRRRHGPFTRTGEPGRPSAATARCAARPYG